MPGACCWCKYVYGAGEVVMFMLIWCWHVQAVDMILIVRSMLRGISCQPVGRFLWFSDTTERGAKIEREALAKNETPDWFSFTAYIEISKYVRIWKNNAMEKKTSQKLRNCPNSRYSKYSRYSRIVKFVWHYEIGRNFDPNCVLQMYLSLSLYLSFSLSFCWSGHVSSSLWSNVSKFKSLKYCSLKVLSKCICHCLCHCHCHCACLRRCLFAGQVMFSHRPDQMSQRSKVSKILRGFGLVWKAGRLWIQHNDSVSQWPK